VQKRVAPSAALEAAIDELLSEGLGDAERLAEVGRLGARLVLQRALEEEVAEFLGRARYERTLEARGSRNGVRPRRVQTAEGELEVQMPQLRETADRFVSKILPDVRTVVRTRPLEALIIGAYVRGLSDRDIESLIQEAGLGKLSKSTASRVCQELRERYRAFRARSLAEVRLLVLFLDAIVRHEAPYDRVGCSGPPPACRSRPVKLGAVRPWRRKAGREQPRQRQAGPALPDGPGLASKTGRCNPREPVVKPPQASEPAPTWRIWAGQQSASGAEWRRRMTQDTWFATDLRAVRKDCGVLMARAAGEKLDTAPVDRLRGERGNRRGAALPLASQVGDGQDRRHPAAPRWGGVPVVVRGRESRPHGEGGQRVRSRGIGMPGGRR